MNKQANCNKTIKSSVHLCLFTLLKFKAERNNNMTNSIGSKRAPKSNTLSTRSQKKMSRL